MNWLADTNPTTVALLDRLTRENRETDAQLAHEDAVRRCREINEAVYLRAIRAWFRSKRQTEPER